jgi:hypothetical protein
MVKGGRALVPGALLAVAVAALYFSLRSDSPVAPAAAGASAPSSRAGSDVPWIQLDRLKVPNPAMPLGHRNIFTYGPAAPVATAPPVMTEVPPATDVPPVSLGPITPQPTPPPPPLNLKFMGIAQPDGGPKIALLLTEQKEILHGKEGDTLAGRYRIMKIGIEQVEIEEVTTGQKQTIRIGGR